jgi:uncharacterized delta-60 repeat protein
VVAPPIRPDPLGMTTKQRTHLVLSTLVLTLVGAAHAHAGPGDPDPSFGKEGKVVRKDLAPANDLATWGGGRKTVIMGATEVAGDDSIYVTRLRKNGRLDRRFANDGTLEITQPGDEFPGGLAVDDKRRIVVSYLIRTSEAEPAFGIARIKPNGKLDRSLDGNGLQTAGFGTGLSVSQVADVAVAEDESIVVSGSVENSDGFHSDFGIVRFTKAGQLDSAFSGDGRKITDFHPGEERDDLAAAVTIDSQGRVVAVGSTNLPATAIDPIAVARYDTAGELDGSLAGDGTLVSDLAPEATDVTTMAGDSIAVSGESAGDFLVARFLADGTPDSAFSKDGAHTIDFDDGADVATSIVRDGGKLVVAGSARSRRRGTDFAVARLKSNGTMDRRFGNEGHKQVDFSRARDEAFGVAVDRLGDVVLGGRAQLGSRHRAGVARLNG